MSLSLCLKQFSPLYPQFPQPSVPLLPKGSAAFTSGTLYKEMPACSLIPTTRSLDLYDPGHWGLGWIMCSLQCLAQSRTLTRGNRLSSCGSQAWWYTSVMPGIGRQEDKEFKVRVSYIMSSMPATEPCLKKEKESGLLLPSTILTGGHLILPCDSPISSGL